MFCKVCRSAEPGGSSAACALVKRVRLDVLGRHGRCKIKELILCVTDRAGLDLVFHCLQLTTLPGLQGDELRLAESELLAHLVRDHRRVGQFTPVHSSPLTIAKLYRNLFCTAPQPVQRSGPLLSNAPP